MLRQDKPDSGVDLPVSIFVETCQEDICLSFRHLSIILLCIGILLESQSTIFSHSGMISCLPGLNQYQTEDKVSCLRTQCNTSGESLTSNFFNTLLSGSAIKGKQLLPSHLHQSHD